jgi:hypothetical protein
LLLLKIFTTASISSFRARTSATRCKHLRSPRVTTYEASQDVSLAAIYVSTKMHDTLKKPRDILMVSYTVLYPDQARSRAVGGDLEGIDPNVGTTNLVWNLSLMALLFGDRKSNKTASVYSPLSGSSSRL